MKKIAVLIPCYNERETIEKVVKDFSRILPSADIYVYDNNSTDGTDEIALRAGAIVRYERTQGKGNVIRRMFREIEADCYILVDGDDTYPAESAPEMAEIILQKQMDMVVGDRLTSTYFDQNKRPFHGFGNCIVRFYINSLFDGEIRDIMTGYRAFSYQFVKTFPVLSRGFEIETEMSIHAIMHNMAIENVIVEYRDRPENSQSKLNTYSDGIKVLYTIFRLYQNYHPLAFFSLLSLLIFLIGMAFMIPILNTYFITGKVPQFPTLIVCMFSFLAALLLLVAGIILSILLYHDKRDFEFKLQQVSQWRKSRQ